jgi:hypothetical protein
LTFLDTYTTANLLLSPFFRKMYYGIVVYHDFLYVRITKRVFSFLFEKKRDKIEFQIDVRQYLGPIQQLFHHMQRFILKKLHLIKAVRCKIYLYDNTRLLPREKTLGFILTGTETSLQSYFNGCLTEYNKVSFDDFYESETMFQKLNLGFVFYFKTIPTSTELFDLDPFIFYERSLSVLITKTRLEKQTRYNRTQAELLAQQAYEELGFTSADNDFPQ